MSPQAVWMFSQFVQEQGGAESNAENIIVSDKNTDNFQVTQYVCSAHLHRPPNEKQTKKID